MWKAIILPLENVKYPVTGSRDREQTLPVINILNGSEALIINSNFLSNV